MIKEKKYKTSTFERRMTNRRPIGSGKPCGSARIALQEKISLLAKRTTANRARNVRSTSSVRKILTELVTPKMVSRQKFAEQLLKQ